MEIETVDDLANAIGDMLGIYGCCKAAELGKDYCDNDNPNCCRIGFMMLMPDRIRKAVENDIKIEKAEFK